MAQSMYREGIRALALGGAALQALILAGAAHAQSAPPAGEAATEEEIVVTGIRQSVEQSIAVKREANAIVDAITAEDIGKLPDQNIAETLQRISGVQVGRGGAGQQGFLGEGSSFTIRGIGQNRVEFNGTNIVGSALGGNAALGDFNPEILSGLTVTKSPSAMDVEGALGGVVNMLSRKPLDEKRGYISLRAEGIYFDEAEKPGYRVSAAVSQKFFDNTLGILLGASRYEYRRLTEEIGHTGFTLTSAIDVTGDGVADPNVYRPSRYTEAYIPAHVTRTALDGAIQWRPSPNLEINFDALYSKSKLDQDASRFQVLLGNTVTSPRVDSRNVITQGTFTNVTPRVTAYEEVNEAEQMIFALYGRWSSGPFEVSVRGAHSEGNSSAILFVPLLVPKTGRTASLYYDGVSGADMPTGVLTTNYNLMDPTQLRLDTTVDNRDVYDNSGDDVRLDLSYDTGMPWLSKVRVGARYEDLRFATQQFNQNVGVATLLAARPSLDRNGDGQIGYEEIGGVSLSAIDGYFAGRTGNIPRTFLGGETDIAAFRNSVGLPVAASSPLGERQIDQKTKAFYGQFDLEGAIGSVEVRGNIGLRYVDTERTARGNLQDPVTLAVTPVAYPAQFKNWLPSLNLSARFTDNLYLRVAAGKVVARPELNLVAPGTRPNVGNRTASRGNPLLTPYTATQYDASLEWYFDKASLLSLAVFYKDVASFTAQRTFTEYLDVGANSGDYQITQPFNAGSGEIKGFEISYQHVFSGLPPLLDGAGVGASYTYVDSSTPLTNSVTGEEDPMPGLSKHSVNLTAFIEQKWGNFRLTYNWRDRYIDNVGSAAIGGNRYNRAYGQLDASAQFNLADDVRLLFTAVNLTKSAEITDFAAGPDYPFGYRRNDRRFYGGVSVRF